MIYKRTKKLSQCRTSDAIKTNFYVATRNRLEAREL